MTELERLKRRYEETRRNVAQVVLSNGCYDLADYKNFVGQLSVLDDILRELDASIKSTVAEDDEEDI